jgi:hypothetical protein
VFRVSGLKAVGATVGTLITGGEVFTTATSTWSSPENAVINPDTKYAAFSAGAFYAGRLWLAPTIDRANELWFSQVATHIGEYSKCYSAENPASENSAGILASDGGVIKIPEMGYVIGMKTVYDKLVIFSTNGVWQISGSGDGEGFRADAYNVTKLSSVECTEAGSIIETESSIFFWTVNGIYVARPQPEGTSLVVAPLSETRINDYVLPKYYVASDYDEQHKRVYWLCSDDPTDYHRQHLLIYDVRLDAFYPYDVGEVTGANNTGAISGIVIPRGYYTDDYKELKVPLVYTYNTATYIDNFEFRIFQNDYGVSDSYTDNLYPYGDGTGVDTDVDWNIDVSYNHLGDPSVDKQLPYITVSMERKTNSSVHLRGKWNWDNGSVGTGKWTSSYEIYRPKGYETGEVVQTKSKLRGTGKVLQLNFYGSGEPATLYGWTGHYTVNNRA